MFFEVNNYVRSIVQRFLNVMNLLQLPVTCPKCHKRNFVHVYIKHDDFGMNQLHCAKCEIIFTRENPKKYKLTPLAQYKQLKQHLIEGRL